MRMPSVEQQAELDSHSTADAARRQRLLRQAEDGAAI